MPVTHKQQAQRALIELLNDPKATPGQKLKANAQLIQLLKIKPTPRAKRIGKAKAENTSTTATSILGTV